MDTIEWNEKEILKNLLQVHDKIISLSNDIDYAPHITALGDLAIAWSTVYKAFKDSREL